MEIESKKDNIHAGCSVGVEAVLRESLYRKTLDNITAVVVAFQNNSETIKL